MRHSIRSQIFTGDHHSLLVVGTDGDDGQSPEEVLRIHDGKLAKMGTDDLTRSAIDSYRKKHFGTADPLVPGQRSSPAPATAAAKTPDKWVPKITKDSLPARSSPAAAVTLDRVSPLPERMPAPTVAEQAAAAVRTVIKPPGAPQPATPPAVVQTSADIAQASAPVAAQTAPADPKPAPAEDVCGICGASVTKSQVKLSQLFMSKTMCKPCMDKSQGAS